MDWNSRVKAWAKDRNLIEGSTPAKQLRKLLEEIGELATAVAECDLDEMKDAIGDTSVVMAVMAAQVGLEWEECLEAAWDSIKHRTGRMVDGIFVKDA